LVQLSEREGLKRSLAVRGIWLSAVQPLPCWIIAGALPFAHLKPSLACFSAYALLRENIYIWYIYSLVSAPEQPHHLIP